MYRQRLAFYATFIGLSLLAVPLLGWYLLPWSAAIELPALIIAVIMLVEVYRHSRQYLMVVGWLLIAIGVGLDFADEFFISERYLMFFDELALQAGLVLVCFYFTRTIGQLNDTINALDQEIGHSKALQGKLTLLAYHDQLTGLLNRRAFFERFDDYVANSQQPYLVYIDLDHFKQVNDRFGHHVGDEVLIRFAGMLRLGTRNNPMAFRFGGDEFVVLCERASITHLETVLATNFAILEHYQVGYAIGYVPISEPLGADKMLSLADEKMYQHKRLARRKARSRDRK